MGLNYLDYIHDINSLKLSFQVESMVKDLFDESTTKEEAVIKTLEILGLAITGTTAEYNRGYEDGRGVGYHEGVSDGYESGYVAGSRAGDF